MAIIRGTSVDDRIIGLDSDDQILAFRGNDTVDGGGGNDRILADYGDDVVQGGAGDDGIFGEHGNDTVDGGADNDRVYGGRGDDIGVHRLSENIGARDYYDGGEGVDTLRLVLTREQANSAAVQADIEAFRQFLEQNHQPNSAGNASFQFTAFDLAARNWENLEVVVVDEPQLPVLSIDDPSVTEGDPGGPNATISFTVTRSGDSGSASSVAYTVSPGSATNPADYNASLAALSGTLTFAAGETSKTITLDITDDQFPEGTESFTVALSGATNATITKAIGIGTIVDDDLPAFSIDDPSVTEGDPGGLNATITFTVTRSGDNGSQSTVAYIVSPGSATNPADYNASLAALNGTLTFAAGETSKTITLDITDDQVPEGTESFTVALSGATNATITKAVGTGTIVDDDLPAFSIDDPSATEGDPGGPNATISFTVTRSGDNGSASTVDYTVNPGSATNPTDYNASLAALSGTLTFAAGESSKTVTLDVTDDQVPEGTESFTVALSGASNAVIAKAVGTGTILDDDLPAFSIDDPSVTEGDPGGPNATISFTVTRGGDNGVQSTVAYAVSPGTATNPADYNASLAALSGSLTFSAGETSKTIALDITDDLVVEGPETFTVTLSDASNAVITKAVGTGTIVDNDAPTLSIDDPSATEGDPGGPNATITFTVTRGGDNGVQSTVAYAVSPGTATNPADYNASLSALSGTLTFAAGESSKTITLDITDDLAAEGSEAFTVTLSGATNAVITKAVGTGTIVDDDDLPPFDIIWTNGGSVVLGSAAAPTSFNVGTNAAVPAGVPWTGATASDNWSQADNWATSPPGVADTAVFGAAGSGTDVVDVDFQIASLRYSGAAGHITDLDNGSTLRVSGATAVHVANANLRSSMAILDRTAVVAHLSELNVGVVTTGSGSATGDLFIGTGASLDGSDVDVLSIGRETGVVPNLSTAANGSLKLASNSTLTLGSVAAPATLNIGWSQNINFGGTGNASGVLDVLDRAAVLNLQLSEVNVGRGALYGAGNGTLKWNQSEVLTAPNVYFGRGSAIGALEVPAGGEFLLGSASAPITNLRIAYNDAGNGTARAALDFSLTNPTFTAFVARELTIGGETGVVPNWSTAANGSLKLASNSTLTLGSVAAPATLNIGWSQNINFGGTGNASGVLDVLDRAAVLNLQLSEVNVGRGALYGAGNGTLKWNQSEVLTAPNVYFGRGSSTGNLAVPAGGEFLLGSASTPVGNLRIAYNDAGAGTAIAALDFSQTNPTFTAFIARELTVGSETGSAGNTSTSANGSLKLASNSSLTLGSVAAPATLNIGWSQNTNFGIGIGDSSASGMLDVLDRAAVLDLHLSEVNVGRGAFDGVGNGTLKWNQSEVLTAPNVYFGRGSSTGNLAVPAGGEFLLGSAGTPVGNLRIAYNDAGAGTAIAALDFSQTNPTFTAFIARELTIGSETGKPFNLSTSANGSLKLASNASLTLGSVAAPATLNIGWSQNTEFGIGIGSASATGVLDASDGGFAAFVSNLNVGVTAAFGSSNGRLILGNGTTLHTNIANIGVGPNATGTFDFVDNFSGSFSATTVNFNNGLFDFGANTLEIGGAGPIVAQTFNMRGGVLTGNAVDINPGGSFNFSGVFNGTLNENGGTLAPGGTAIATATVNGNYNLAAAGTLAIQLSAAAEDQLIVNGVVDLNGSGATGGTLDVVLTAAPQLNDSFTILLNDGSDAILGEFAGLPDGATFNETFGSDTFTFAIDYQGGDGNDATLLVTNIASASAPAPLARQGDGGSDTFVFDTAPQSATNADATMLGGASSASEGGEFRASASGNAAGGDDYMVYDASTGSLYHDAAGQGEGATPLFAKLTGLSSPHDHGAFIALSPGA